MSHKIIDNYLSKEDFKKLKDIITGDTFPWFYNRSVADTNNENEKNTYFSHMIFNMTAQSSFFDIFYEKLIKHISPTGLRRIKVNLYPKSEKLIYHPKHVDFPFPHKGFILYLNTCNGFTILNDGTKIETIENRGLFFDSSLPHNSTTCTDKKRRLNINVNYF